jgi:hypothetical protein
VRLADVATNPCIRMLGADMPERLSRLRTAPGVVGFSAVGLVTLLRGEVGVRNPVREVVAGVRSSSLVRVQIQPGPLW